MREVRSCFGGSGEHTCYCKVKQAPGASWCQLIFLKNIYLSQNQFVVLQLLPIDMSYLFIAHNSRISSQRLNSTERSSTSCPPQASHQPPFERDTTHQPRPSSFWDASLQAQAVAANYSAVVASASSDAAAASFPVLSCLTDRSVDWQTDRQID